MTTHTVTTVKGKPFIRTGEGLIPVIDATEDLDAVLSRRACMAGVRKGVPNDPENCHYAVALREEKTVGVIDSRVRKNFTYLRLADRQEVFVRYKNTAAIRDFIAAFDESDGKAIHIGDSFTAHLLAIPKSEKFGYRRGKSGTKSKRKSPSYYERRCSR